jgi:hypothetical protein
MKIRYCALTQQSVTRLTFRCHALTNPINFVMRQHRNPQVRVELHRPLGPNPTLCEDARGTMPREKRQGFQKDMRKSKVSALL